MFSMFDQSQIQEFKEVGRCELQPWEDSCVRMNHLGGWQGTRSSLNP